MKDLDFYNFYNSHTDIFSGCKDTYDALKQRVDLAVYHTMLAEMEFSYNSNTIDELKKAKVILDNNGKIETVEDCATKGYDLMNFLLNFTDISINTLKYLNVELDGQSNITVVGNIDRSAFNKVDITDTDTESIINFHMKNLEGSKGRYPLEPYCFKKQKKSISWLALSYIPSIITNSGLALKKTDDCPCDDNYQFDTLKMTKLLCYALNYSTIWRNVPNAITLTGVGKLSTEQVTCPKASSSMASQNEIEPFNQLEVKNGLSLNHSKFICDFIAKRCKSLSAPVFAEEINIVKKGLIENYDKLYKTYNLKYNYPDICRAIALFRYNYCDGQYCDENITDINTTGQSIKTFTVDDAYDVLIIKATEMIEKVMFATNQKFNSIDDAKVFFFNESGKYTDNSSVGAKKEEDFCESPRVEAIWDSCLYEVLNRGGKLGWTKDHLKTPENDPLFNEYDTWLKAKYPKMPPSTNKGGKPYVNGYHNEIINIIQYFIVLKATNKPHATYGEINIDTIRQFTSRYFPEYANNVEEKLKDSLKVDVDKILNGKSFNKSLVNTYLQGKGFSNPFYYQWIEGLYKGLNFWDDSTCESKWKQTKSDFKQITNDFNDLMKNRSFKKIMSSNKAVFAIAKTLGTTLNVITGIVGGIVALHYFLNPFAVHSSMLQSIMTVNNAVSIIGQGLRQFGTRADEPSLKKDTRVYTQQKGNS